MEILSLWEKVNAVSETKHVHRVEPSELNIIKTHFYCEDTSFTIHPLLSNKNPTVTKGSEKQLAVGDYVIVKYDEEFYPGELITLGEYANKRRYCGL